MLQLKIQTRGLTTIQGQLAAMARRASDKPRFLSYVGHRTALTLVPLSLRKNEMNAPAPKYRKGQPMVDTGRLRASIAYVASATSVTVGTSVKYGHILNVGGVIKPRFRKWLLIPLSPPLSVTEVRAFPQGSAAIKARYPGSFFLEKGPEGPGIYRPRQSGRIQRIAMARRSVTIKARKWLVWREAWLADFSRAWAEYALTGKGMPQRALSGGTWDRGGSGGLVN